MQVSSMLSEQSPYATRHQPPKYVAFEYLLDGTGKHRGRIPLRVLVNGHDTTESIVTTVKNFYGMYDGSALSFEDASGNTLIASYDNFADGATVYVRSVAGASQSSPSFSHETHPFANGTEPQRRPSLGEPFQALPAHMREHSRSPTRSASRLANKRSTSPQSGRGRRSASQQKHNGSYPGSRGSSVNGSAQDGDNDQSDSDAGRSSVSGSRKAKSEQFVSSDISTANVLLDGRRGGPIFDSSALPLFAPPQVPVTASQSSISPQRRSGPHDGPSPFQLPALKLSNIAPPPMLSPQSFQNGSANGAHPSLQQPAFSTPRPQHNHRLRDRSSLQAGAPNATRGGYGASGVLPTPDPTVASCISDEDVARTLILLGDASNFSHGRTSNSTIDDAFSGAADAASSTGATSDSDEYSDSEGGQPKHRKYLDDGDDEYAHEAAIKSEFDEHDGPPKTKKIKTKMHDGPSPAWKVPEMGLKSTKSGKPRSHPFPKPSSKPGIGQVLPKVVTAPPIPTPQRKGSSSSAGVASVLGPDEEDLSAKPRCQRCRKSKKGCDRQRPCGRCKDAGIGIGGCVSEDEGNGRKGRYGRHMGVTVKKTAGQGFPVEEDEAQDTAMSEPTSAMFALGMDKSKKRKR